MPKADTRIEEGDLVRIPPLRLPEKLATPEVSDGLKHHLEAAILYEDEG